MKKFIIICAGVIVVVGSNILFFNRAPDRTIPDAGIVSPASGRVIDIRKTDRADIIFDKKGTSNHVMLPEIAGPVWVIVIEMTPLDVHVQRAPIAGSIIRMDHYDGRHANALGKEKLELVNENEKMITIFNHDADTVGVVQVAGMAARRIRNTSVVGDVLAKGDRYGRIILGSQVVVIIPAAHDPLVAIGNRVVDGETVLAQ